ncbi:DNA repair protein RadA [Ruminococcus champanellensis]|uniref:DNA repair protein RadA n=1 Tax=Ruminococcus champanellensis (strain DSM 18848 / JCM 17042 / KCTC 15320 / 18P13) TaxID=213810 RepID=D4LCD8_RUMC1|nr:DNA repair protein RadA [Ruminococcus champanellensis]CBL17283.1 DNA repair protein RadA [Ruminococcus champanellensis 18P13 = JCM 17042]
MAKARTVYVCTECGYESLKWNGKCAGCGAWNSLEESTPAPAVKSAPGARAAVDLSDRILELSQVDMESEVRYRTGMGELDRVLGGGLVKGELVLLGGEPGIGKSTLLLQICQYLGQNHSVLYVSGEESARQIKLRAQRLGVDTESLYLLTVNDAEAICDTICSTEPDVVIIDSIQTMSLSQISSSPGSLTQVRECTNLFMHTAKRQEIPIFIVGHVNKDGAIAGPKVMEHIVDAVLYFEGERHLSYRILRAVKNRFGSTNEIGVFEMIDKGLREVENPSQMLLAGRPHGVSGTCVACVMEGSRPILAEVQALATKSGFSSPRRMSTGVDFGRMAIIMAVLEKRLGMFFGTLDVYLNIVGGFRLDEPAGDLPVALALSSCLLDKPIDEKLIAFGEIGLGGEVRSVTHLIQRVREAERMGFETCIVPKQSLQTIDPSQYNMRIIGVSSLKQAVSVIA